MRLNRRVLIALTSLVLACGLSTVHAQQPGEAAAEPVKKLYGKVEETLKAGVPDLKARVDALGPTFREVFDLPAMAQIAVGSKWKSLKPDQQKAVADTFETYFTTLYANRLSQAAGGKFDITPGSETRGGNAVVHSKVTTKDGENSQVDYVVNPAGKIQDVLLDGSVSEAAALRAGFSEPLKKGGPDALIKFMNERTEMMSAAKPKP